MFFILPSVLAARRFGAREPGVTHIHEFTVGGQREYGSDTEALTAHDTFISYVDSKRTEKRAVFATPSEISELGFAR